MPRSKAPAGVGLLGKGREKAPEAFRVCAGRARTRSPRSRGTGGESYTLHDSQLDGEPVEAGRHVMEVLQRTMERWVTRSSMRCSQHEELPSTGVEANNSALLPEFHIWFQL